MIPAVNKNIFNILASSPEPLEKPPSPPPPSVEEPDTLKALIEHRLSQAQPDIHLKHLFLYLKTLEEREKEPLHFDALLDEMDLLRLAVEETIHYLRAKYQIAHDQELHHYLPQLCDPLIQSKETVPLALRTTLCQSTAQLKLVTKINACVNYFHTAEMDTTEEAALKEYLHQAILFAKKDGGWTVTQQKIFSEQQELFKKSMTLLLTALLQEQEITFTPPLFKKTVQVLDASLRSSSPIPPPSLKNSHPLLEETLSLLDQAKKQDCCGSYQQDKRNRLKLEALDHVEIYLQRLRANLSSEGLYTTTLRRLTLIRRAVKELLIASLYHLENRWKSGPLLADQFRRKNNPRILEDLLCQHFYKIQKMPPGLSWIHINTSYPYRFQSPPNPLSKLIHKVLELKEKEVKNEGEFVPVYHHSLSSEKLKEKTDIEFLIPALHYMNQVFNTYLKMQ